MPYKKTHNYKKHLHRLVSALEEGNISYEILKEEIRKQNNIAKCSLGALYYNGSKAIDIEKSRRKSLKWFMKAAENGNNESKYFLEDLFFSENNIKEKLNEPDFLTNNSLDHNIAHDILTPLSNIRINAESLNISMPKDDFKQIMKNILDSNNRMIEIIKSELEIAKISANIKDIKIKKLNIEEAIKNTLQVISNEINKQNINILIKMVNPNLNIKANQKHVERCLGNIIKNAIDFNFNNKDITIKTLDLKDGVSIEVYDEGVGIPPNKLNEIYDKFYTTPRPKTSEKSSGLGLNIVKTIMDIHNGSITIQNREDKQGVVAKLFFPNQQQENNQLTNVENLQYTKEENLNVHIIKFYKKDAEQGDSKAQYNLGKAYQDEHDYTKAVHWFKLSATQNHKIALSNLAYYYLNGKGGCNKNFSKAIYLYKKAAERNYYHFKNN
jgi:nitrogen-specific signal transduction histidine kinase